VNRIISIIIPEDLRVAIEEADLFSTAGEGITNAYSRSEIPLPECGIKVLYLRLKKGKRIPPVRTKKTVEGSGTAKVP
jgi:hypothetical protein